MVDLTPSAEAVLQDPGRSNAGTAVERSAAPADQFCLGSCRVDYLWQASVGFRVPPRVLKLTAHVPSVGTEFVGVLEGRGLGATVALEVG